MTFDELWDCYVIGDEPIDRYAILDQLRMPYRGTT